MLVKEEKSTKNLLSSIDVVNATKSHDFSAVLRNANEEARKTEGVRSSKTTTLSGNVSLKPNSTQKDPLYNEYQQFAREFSFSSKTFLERIKKKGFETNKNFFRFRYVYNQTKDSTDIKEYKKEKKFVKYSYWFFKKIESAIFSFNLKNYDKCYEELKASGIINDDREFAQFLIIIPGFNKMILGEFLSKDKGKNIHLVFLKLFMDVIDFTDFTFLEAMRFLLSKIELPKDANLILTIIDEFTQRFYEDNKTNKNFPDSGALYLLASSILAVNTMLSRTDIKNLVIMKRDEFISMNSKCDPKFVGEIYDDLKENKIELVRDYDEMIYNRLLVQDSSHDQSNQEPNNNELSDQGSNQYLVVLKRGQCFLKYGQYKTPHERFFQLSKDEMKLKWKNVCSCNLFQTIKSVKVKDMKDVCIGSGSTEVFQKAKIHYNFDQNCFSIVTDKRTIDLKNENEAVTKKWYYAIKFLIRRNKGLSELKSNKALSDKDKDEIWKTEILLKWSLYRKYVVGKAFNEEGEGQKKRFWDFSFFSKKKIADNNKSSEKMYFDKYEFFDIWSFGIPVWLRKKIWSIVIGNHLGISENLVHYYEEMIKAEEIPIEEYDKRYLKEKSNKITKDESKKILFDNDAFLNKIINDVIKITNKPHILQKISDEKVSKSTFLRELYKVVRLFTLYRSDMRYSKQITNFSAIFLLNSENFYEAFMNLANFIIPSIFSKFIQHDEEFIGPEYTLFNKLLDHYLPKINAHFKKLELYPNSFLDQWLSSAFSKTFRLDMVLRLWDIYLIKGDIFIYEIALAILKMEENDLLNLPMSSILTNLKRIPDKYTDEDFFKILNNQNIYKIYKQEQHLTKLGTEKMSLMAAYIKDDF